ncbi:hypothetical protein ACERK3_00790 [Phycisphaerales bacterium AB-hyl4]|uniref:AMIN domain-containing protein n=1 Tax=Natronomicrosphaera hydrolytica TaxID=3242702 RepID=A0ABV4U1V1_9BACT
MHVRERFAMPMMLGLALLLVTSAGGCASWDRHVFQSTEDRPTSVAVIDAADGEALWAYDIPPNHRLTLDLANSGEVGAMRVSGRPATHMNWKLHQMESGSMAEFSSRRVGGGRVELESRAIRINVDYDEPRRRARSPEPEAIPEAVDEDAVEFDVNESAEPDADDVEADTEDEGSPEDDDDSIEAAMAEAADGTADE